LTKQIGGETLGGAARPDLGAARVSRALGAQRRVENSELSSKDSPEKTPELIF
jgi:hypothetical protein